MTVYKLWKCQVHVNVASFLEFFAPKNNKTSHMAVLHGMDRPSNKLDYNVLFQIKHPLAIWKTPGSS